MDILYLTSWVGPEVIKICLFLKLPFDVHLMISPVNNFIKDFADAGADIITFHPEATKDVSETINLIKKLGKKVGISLKQNSQRNLILKPFERDRFNFNYECRTRLWRSKVYA